MTREEYVAALRTLANFYEAQPTLPVPEGYSDELRVSIWIDAEKFPEVARALGSAEKVADENYFHLRKTLPGVVLDYFNARDAVCTKHVIGMTRTVEKVATAWEEKEVEKEIVRWECPESLLAPKVEEPAA